MDPPTRAGQAEGKKKTCGTKNPVRTAAVAASPTTISNNQLLGRLLTPSSEEKGGEIHSRRGVRLVAEEGRGIAGANEVQVPRNGHNTVCHRLAESGKISRHKTSVLKSINPQNRTFLSTDVSTNVAPLTTLMQLTISQQFSVIAALPSIIRSCKQLDYLAAPQL